MEPENRKQENTFDFGNGMSISCLCGDHSSDSNCDVYRLSQGTLSIEEYQNKAHKSIDTIRELLGEDITEQKTEDVKEEDQQKLSEKLPPQDQEKKSPGDRLKPWHFQPGKNWTGNANGRPKGKKSLKTWVRERLEEMDEEERFEFLKGMKKDFVWEMAEGKANLQADITSGGKPIGATDEALAKKAVDDYLASLGTTPNNGGGGH